MSIIGVIGGSGLYGMPGLRVTEDRAVSTPYGEPSAPYRLGELSGVKAAFLPRHGPDHKIPPHRINYRANIWGFRELGVQRVVSVSASGGINPDLRPGDIVVADQVIDLTQGARQSTFYDSETVVHVDFTDPYCPELRQAIIASAEHAGIAVKRAGTYICVNGPRLESKAEIRFFGSNGADIIGMTGMPEASLARELEICFSAVSVVTNYAAGISGRKLTTVEVVRTMEESTERIRKILGETITRIPPERACPCGKALEDSRMG
jgi:5'-methylthioadenosine phosphorylase